MGYMYIDARQNLRFIPSYLGQFLSRRAMTSADLAKPPTKIPFLLLMRVVRLQAGGERAAGPAEVGRRQWRIAGWFRALASLGDGSPLFDTQVAAR